VAAPLAAGVAPPLAAAEAEADPDGAVEAGREADADAAAEAAPPAELGAVLEDVVAVADAPQATNTMIATSETSLNTCDSGERRVARDRPIRTTRIGGTLLTVCDYPTTTLPAQGRASTIAHGWCHDRRYPL
jgi:hypothetical protein